MAITVAPIPPRSPAPTEPDMDWYLGVSRARGVTPRCPFASVERCPRYYQSRSLLGEAGSTKIPTAEDERLKAQWGRSGLWPKTAEEATSIAGGANRYTMFSNFCPEVAYDRFRLFASGFGEYADEIDRDTAYQMLSQRGAASQSWRWTWAYVMPMHFTECPLYSPLLHSPGLVNVEQKEILAPEGSLWSKMKASAKALGGLGIGFLWELAKSAIKAKLGLK